MQRLTPLKTSDSELQLHKVIGVTCGKQQVDGGISLLTNMLTGTALFICAGFGNHATSIIALLVFFTYVVYLAFTNLKVFFKYLFFIFAIVSNIVGVASCEFSDLYLTELVIWSGYVGSLPLIIFSRWLFLALLIWLDSRYGKDVDGERGRFADPKKSKWLDVGTLLTLIVVAMALIDVMRYEPTFLSGMNRFNWNMAHSDRLVPAQITDNMIYLLVFPVLSLRYGGRRIGVAALAVYIAYSLWVGVKFGGYFQLVCIITLVYYDRIIRIDRKLLQRIALGLLSLVAALVFGAVQLHSYSSSSDFSATDYLLSRTAQQGQLWWRTFDLAKVPHVEDFENEIDVILHGDPTERMNHVGSKQGLYMIMYLTAPTGVIDNKLSTSSSYTEGGYAAAYYYFGFIGPFLFSIVLALLVSFFTNHFLRSLIHARLIDSVVHLRLLFMTITFMSMFHLGLFGQISLLCYAYLLLSKLLRKQTIPSNSSVSVAGDTLKQECLICCDAQSYVPKTGSSGGSWSNHARGTNL